LNRSKSPWQRASQDQFFAAPVDDVEKSVAVGLQDQVFFTLIDPSPDLCGVVVMLVMLRKLVMPFESSGVGIERQQGIAVKIVARSPFAAIRKVKDFP